jgi:hypothetical protein
VTLECPFLIVPSILFNIHSLCNIGGYSKAQEVKWYIEHISTRVTWHNTQNKDKENKTKKKLKNKNKGDPHLFLKGKNKNRGDPICS